MNLNDDTKQFIANGIALKFGEMATRLVKQHKFYSPEYGSHEIDAYSEWESEDNQAADDDIDHALNEYYAAVESGRGVDEAKTNATAALDRYKSHLTGESRNKAGNQPRYDDPEQVNDIVNAIGQAIQDPEGGRVSVDEAKKSSVTASDKRQAAAEEAKKKEQDEQWANRPYAEDWRVEEAAARIEAEEKGIVDEDYEREMAGGEGGEEKPKPAPGEEQHWDFWRQEYQAGRMDQDELEEKMAPYIEKYGPEINEGIIEREEERIDAEVYPTGKGSGRCPDGSRKDPKTGQCKPHQARQAMNDNVKMYIANGIAMRFGQVAANFVKTMKFQDKYTHGDIEEFATLLNTASVVHKTAKDSPEWGSVRGKVQEHIETAYGRLSKEAKEEMEIGGGEGFMGEVGNLVRGLDDAETDPMDLYNAFNDMDDSLGRLVEHEMTGYGDFEFGIDEGVYESALEGTEWEGTGLDLVSTGEHTVTGRGALGADTGGAGAEGGDTGVEGGGEWPGGPGGKGPKRDQYEWEQDSQGSVTITDTTTGASAFIQVGSDGLSELKAELKNAPDEHSQQLIMDQYSTIMDPPEGGGGAEGEGEEKKSRSDRCETGTHKDPKTGQCKPI